MRYGFANMLDLVRGPIAQRLEQQTHNLLVPGSNPGGPTTYRPGPADLWLIGANSRHQLYSYLVDTSAAWN